MALFSINSVRFDGVAACVPKNNVSNYEDNSVLNSSDLKKLIHSTGIENRRISEKDISSSDLCFAAAEKLIEDLEWNKDEIELLIFISQTPDYILPNTSTILQDKLKLPRTCIAFDMTLGCSAYVYGISTIASFMSSTGLKKGLLLVGDTLSKVINPKDKSTYPLFGDAGSATAFSYNSEAPMMHFNLNSDGSGHKAIIIPHGGSRGIVSNDSFIEEDVDGLIRNKTQLHLEGIDVFNFSISKVPTCVTELLEYVKLKHVEVDNYVFHQANLLMNEFIRKRLKLEVDQVPYSLADFGNTSSATIPLTFVHKLKKAATENSFKNIFCGFGVGLSWGAAFISTDNIVVPDIIEL